MPALIRCGNLLLLLDASGAGIAAGRGLVLELADGDVVGVRDGVDDGVGARAVNALFEDGLGFDLLELGLEVLRALGEGVGVGAAARIRHVVVVVLDFVAYVAPVVSVLVLLRLWEGGRCHWCGDGDDREGRDEPVALSAAFLLDFLRIGVDEAGLGEELGQMLLLRRVAGVVFLAELVRSCHCVKQVPSAIAPQPIEQELTRIHFIFTLVEVRMPSWQGRHPSLGSSKPRHPTRDTVAWG
jgi:hypothetical protein